MGFATPHRISRLGSYLEQEPPRFGFEQAAGVDGNYMRPVGCYASVSAPGVQVSEAQAVFTWTDEVEGDPPQARSTLEQRVEVGEASGVVLAGIRFESQCDSAKQPADCPCNSNGLWPFKMDVSVSPVAQGACTVNVELHRAWTPMKGGLPPVEIKPLNRHLDLRLEVRLTVLRGGPDALSVTPGPVLETRSEARRGASSVVTTSLNGEAERYPTAVAGLTRFGFELLQTGDKPRHRHRGRYIGNLRFHLEDGAYDADAGRLQVHHHSQVWVPVTVVPTDVRYTMQSALIQLGEGSRVASNQEVEGQLCFNSTEQAPFFTRWCKCGRPETGPEQSAVVVNLSA